MPRKDKKSISSNTIIKTLTLAACAMLIGAAISGCAEIRKVTYPSDFKYIEKGEVRSAMVLFASSLWDINDLLTRKGVTEYERGRVDDLLEGMEKKADSLDPKGNPTNHPLIGKNLENFRSEISEAREALKESTPNYYLAGQLYGKCLACHEDRDLHR